MQMSGTGGYILIGFKVRSAWGQGCLANLELQAVTDNDKEGEDDDSRPSKKQKTED